MKRAARCVLSLILAVSVAGCAGPGNAARLAAGQEAMCRCCNCLIPAGTKPTDTCPACTCGHVVSECDHHKPHKQ